jgi:TonB family protein
MKGTTGKGTAATLTLLAFAFVASCDDGQDGEAGSPAAAVNATRPFESAARAPERIMKGTVRRRMPLADAAPGAGTLDAELVFAEVSRRMGGLKGCYERALRTDATLAGRITVRFVIGPDGAVTEASAKGSELPAEVDACITGKVRTFRFPAPQGGAVTFEMPFLFTPAE